MKPLQIIAVVLLFIIICFSISQRHAVMPADAVVNKYNNGLFVFTDSRPSFSYDVIGSVKVSSFVSSYSYVRSMMLVQAKNKYPYASAIIVHMDDYTADVIKFK